MGMGEMDIIALILLKQSFLKFYLLIQILKLIRNYQFYRHLFKLIKH